jgi:preprotein translocase subunit YajC
VRAIEDEVLLTIVEFLSWLQPDPAGGAGAAGGAEAGPGGCAGGSGQLLLLPLMFVVFYFLLIRPQQKQQKQHEELLKSLKAGDKVRTSSGIRGEIARIGESDVDLIIADRVKINVLRSHIAGLDAPPPDKAAADKAGKQDETKDAKSDVLASKGAKSDDAKRNG